MPEDELPLGCDAELSEMYRLAERLAGELPAAQPDWCSLARIARDLTSRLEARCTGQDACA